MILHKKTIIREHGADGFPFVKIGRNVVRGFSPGEFERLLRSA